MYYARGTPTVSSRHTSMLWHTDWEPLYYYYFNYRKITKYLSKNIVIAF